MRIETKPDWWTVAPNLPNHPEKRYPSQAGAVSEAFRMLNDHAEAVFHVDCPTCGPFLVCPHCGALYDEPPPNESETFNSAETNPGRPTGALE